MRYSKRRKGPITLDWIKECCVIDEKGCWLWQRAVDGHGYGQAGENGKLKTIIRVVMEIVEGKSDCLVRHSCDTPLCCNPEHLTYGTKSDNAIDTRDRLENMYGQRLSRDQAFKIKYEEAGTLREIAERYGVCLTQIHNIKSGNSWKDI